MKKSLIAQYYKDIEKHGDSILIYKNPTGKEFDEIMQYSRWHSVRFFMQQNGTTYAWDGAILHSSMEDWVPEISGPVHFEFNKNGSTWCYIMPEILNAEILEEYFKKFPFNKYGFKNTDGLRIDYRYYDAPYDEAYDGVSTLQEFYDNVKYEKEQNSKAEEPANTMDTTNEMTDEEAEKQLNKEQEDFNMNNYIMEQLNKPLDASKKSRLKKKAEFYDGVAETYGEMVEVYKNPTQKEINLIKKNGSYNDFRGLLYKDGTLYLWNAEFYHERLISSLKQLDFKQYHIFTGGPKWIRLHNDGVTIYEDEAREALNKCKSLEFMVNISNDVTLNIVGLADKDGHKDQYNYYDTPLKDFMEGKNVKLGEDEEVDITNNDKSKSSNSDESSSNKPASESVINIDAYDMSDSDISDSDDYGMKVSTNISRLKKNAEFFDGIMSGNDMIEIYKNPTEGEFNKLLRKSKWHSVRLFEKEDGTVYAWDSDILHDSMARQRPSIKGPVHAEIFDDGQIDLFIEPSIKDAKMLRIYLDKLPLYNYGVNNSSMMNIDIMYYNAPNDPIYGEVSTLKDFYDLLDGKKELYE